MWRDVFSGAARSARLEMSTEPLKPTTRNGCQRVAAGGRAELLDAAYGAGKPGLNLDNIRDVAVALPSLDEQTEILNGVTAVSKIADTVEQRFAWALACSDNVARSILAKAFRGELVPTEADLAREEGRDYENAASCS